MCACVRVCVCVRACACECACVRFPTHVRTVPSRYYGQLEQLCKRFPFSDGTPWNGILPAPISICFTWTDPLAVGGLFKSAKKACEFLDGLPVRHT